MSKIINIDVGIECKIKNIEVDGTHQSNICLSTGNQKNIKVKFNFVDDDWKKSGLIKRATFRQINIDRTYFTDIDSNGQADIPYEVLISPGILLIGACGYTESNNVKDIILSPIPQKFEVVPGSYSTDMIPSGSPEPDDFEKYKESISTQLMTINNELKQKVDKIAGKGLSTKDFTDEYEKKLKNIEAKAQVNIIENISINGEEIPINDKRINIDLKSIEKDVDDNTSRIKRIEADLFDSGEATGVSINVKDSTLAEMQGIKTTDNVNGWKQGTTKGYQLFDVNDKNIFNSGVVVDDEDFITVNYDNTDGSDIKFFNIFTNASDLLNVNTNYNIIMEIKNVSGDGGIRLVSDGQNKSQFLTDINYLFSTLQKNMIYKNINKTKISFEDTAITTMLRTFVSFGPGIKGSITFRISVVPENIDTNNFVYEKFTGGQASPSPNFPQDIEVVESGDYEVTSCNKNLCDITKFVNTSGSERPADTYERVENGFIFQNINGLNRICIFKCNMKKDKTYTVSYKTKQLGTVTADVSAYLPTLNQYFYQNRITPNQDTNIVGFYISQTYIGQDVKVEVTDIQVEEATESTDFEPHQESKLPVTIPEGEFYARPSKEWGDILYTKYIESEKKTHLFLEKNVGRIVLDGTEKWYAFDNHNGEHYITANLKNDNLMNSSNNSPIVVKSNKLIGASINDTLYGQILNSISSSASANYFQVCLPQTIVKNLEDVKQFFVENNCLAYYALAKPYTLDLGVRDMPLTFWTETNVFNDFPLPVELAIYYYCDLKRTKTQLLEDMRLAQQDIIALQNDVAKLKEQVATILASMAQTESEVIENDIPNE